MDLYDRLGSVRATAEFDSNKIDLVSEHKWWLLTGGYVACHAKGGKNLRLHRLVTGWVDAGQYIDHIDGNPLNNRCDNLRLVSQSINLGNMHRKPSSNSGYMGVYFDKKRGNYQAHVGHHGTTIHLGRYKTAEEAAAAYNAKKIELFGEHASLNVLD